MALVYLMMPRLRYILILMVVSMCANAQTPPLNYWLTLDAKALHVTLKYLPVELDSTVFQYGEPMFGGQHDIFKGVTNVFVIYPARFRVDEKKRLIVVYHDTPLPIDIRYDIIDTHTKQQGTRGELFRPIISSDYFYSHGLNIFLNPMFRDSLVKREQTVRWTTRPSYPFFFGSNPKASDPHVSVSAGSVDEYQMAPITVAKDLDVQKITLDGTNNYLVTRTGGLKEEDRRNVKRWFTTYDAGLKKFWHEPLKTFSLILQPFLEIDHDISGIAYPKGFIGKYHGDTLLTVHRMLVLSHEIDHHWIGQLIDFGTGQQWFGEGFNDFVAAHLLISTNLISPAQYEKEFNATLSDHYKSKIRNTPNDSIFKNYWKLGDFSRLPYRRGNIFAFYLDNQITLRSNGKSSLRNLLLDLNAYKKSKPEEYQLKISEFIDLASKYLPREQIATDLETYIRKGNPIDFVSVSLLDFYRIDVVDGIPKLTITDPKKFQLHLRLD